MTLPKYSTDAIFALAVLKAKQNDIDVYVEDKRDWRLPANLIAKHIPKNYKISDVYRLGGRGPVIQSAAKAPNNPGRVELYLYDPDIDLLAFGRIDSSLHLVSLTRYCVENFLLTNEAVFHAIVSEAAEFNDTEIQKAANMAELETTAMAFQRLFFWSATAKRLGYKRPITYGFGGLSKRNAGHLVPCRTKIREHTRAMIQDLRQSYSRDKIRDNYNFVRSNARRFDSVIDYLPGKDILIPLLFESLRGSLKIGGSRRSFCQRASQSDSGVVCKKLKRKIQLKLNKIAI